MTRLFIEHLTYSNDLHLINETELVATEDDGNSIWASYRMPRKHYYNHKLTHIYLLKIKPKPKDNRYLSMFTIAVLKEKPIITNPYKNLIRLFKKLYPKTLNVPKEMSSFIIKIKNKKAKKFSVTGY